MDGTDGIATTQGVFMLSVAAIIGGYSNHEMLASDVFIWMIAIIGALGGFLFLNWPPAKIFMGDAGSLWLGFVIFSTALSTIQSGWLAYEQWIILGALFVCDASVTLIIRMIKREHWREGHRNHAYQRLARLWGSHRSILLLALSINLFWILPMTILSVYWSQWSGIIAFVAYLPILIGCVVVNTGSLSQKTVN
jgi:Fuc2NAc and GlcNAc transferase